MNTVDISDKSDWLHLLKLRNPVRNLRINLKDLSGVRCAIMRKPDLETWMLLGEYSPHSQITFNRYLRSMPSVPGFHFNAASLNVSTRRLTVVRFAGSAGQHSVVNSHSSSVYPREARKSGFRGLSPSRIGTTTDTPLYSWNGFLPVRTWGELSADERCK